MARYRADGLAGLTDTETTLALGVLWLTFMVAATSILYFGARLREQMRSGERATERFVKIGEKLAFARQLRADVDHPEKFNEMAEEAVLIAREFDAAKAELPRSWRRYRLTIIFGSLVAVVAVLSGFHIGRMSRQSLSDLLIAPAFVQAAIQTNPGLAGLLIQVEFITIVFAFSIALGMLILMRDKEENRRALGTADTIVKMFGGFLIGVGSFFFGINALVDRYKGMESHSVQLEQDVAAARERTMELEQEVSTARARKVALEQEVSAARERALALEREVSTARERAVAFEQAAREATEQTTRAARESPAASKQARTALFDATDIQQGLPRSGEARQGSSYVGRGRSDPRGARRKRHTRSRERALLKAPRQIATGSHRRSLLKTGEGCRPQSRCLCPRSSIRRASAGRLDDVCLSQRRGLGATDMDVDRHGQNVRRGRAYQGSQRRRNNRGRVHASSRSCARPA